MDKSRREFFGTPAGLAAAAAGVVSTSGAVAAEARPSTRHTVRPGVATYSYQEEVMAGAMDCEAVIREIADIGAYGLELIAEMLVPQFPNPPTRWVDQWHGWIDHYGVKPVAYTQFVDTMRTYTHNLTVEEGVQTMVRDIKLAKLLGIPHVRALMGTPIEILEGTLPHLERYDIWLGVELHYPVRIDSPLVERLRRIAEQHPHFGFVPDFGIFQNKPNPYARDLLVRKGALTRDAAAYIEDAWSRGTDKADVVAQLARMQAGPSAADYAASVYRIAPLNPRDLLPIMRSCKHIHGKTWGLDETCRDPAIDLTDVIPVLKSGGYDGVIATEYEGQRLVQDVQPLTAVEMVRRHHVMLRRLLEA